MELSIPATPRERIHGACEPESRLLALQGTQAPQLEFSSRKACLARLQEHKRTNQATGWRRRRPGAPCPAAARPPATRGSAWLSPANKPGNRLRQLSGTLLRIRSSPPDLQQLLQPPPQSTTPSLQAAEQACGAWAVCFARSWAFQPCSCAMLVAC
jgi:hypothetical protein